LAPILDLADGDRRRTVPQCSASRALALVVRKADAARACIAATGLQSVTQIRTITPRPISCISPVLPHRYDPRIAQDWYNSCRHNRGELLKDSPIVTGVRHFRTQPGRERQLPIDVSRTACEHGDSAEMLSPDELTFA